MIVLEESIEGTRKISEYTGRIAINESICRSAGFGKGDPVIVTYEDKKIIMLRGED
jgi:hypothetical protein